MSKKPKNPVSDEQEDEWRESADRVYRGGNWFNYPYYLRSAQRSYNGPNARSSNFGFRIVKNIPKDQKEKK